RIVTGNHILGPVLDIDVRRDAFVLNRPAIIAREKTSARCNGRTAIDERRRISCVDQSTPGPLADQSPNLPLMEHEADQVSARAGHLVNDNALWAPVARRRTGEGITIPRNVIEVTIKVTLQNINDVIGR